MTWLRSLDCAFVASALVINALPMSVNAGPPCAFPVSRAGEMRAVNAAALDFARDDREVCVAIDQSSGVAVAAWSVNQTLGNDYDVFYSRSTDGGATWSPANALNSDAQADAEIDQLPSVAGANGTFIAVWQSNVVSGSDGDIYFCRSTDGGETWSELATLNSNASTDAPNDHDLNARVATDGQGNWICVWDSNDPSGGTTGFDLDVFFSRSTDDGVTWSDPALVDMGGMSDTFPDRAPVIGCDGADQWIVCWQVNGIGVFRSDDDGLNWTSAGVLDPGSFAAFPDLAGAGGGHWLISATKDAPDSDTFVYRSTDGGNTWSEAIRPVPDIALNANEDERAKVSFDSTGGAIVVWESAEPFGGGLGFDREIIMCASADFGLTWGPPTSVNDGALDSQFADEEPIVAPLGSGEWLVVWKSTNALNGTIGTDYDVVAARVHVSLSDDCDGNGIGDGCDIIAGSTLDQNNDGILDNCQSQSFPNASLTELLRTGDPAPGGGVFSTSFGFPRCANDTEDFVFKPTTLANIGAAILLFEGGRNLILAAQGDTPPGTPRGVTFLINSDPFGDFDLNTQEQVVFEADLIGPGVQFENRVGIWLASTSGMTFIARGNDPAPGIPGLTLETSDAWVRPVIGETGAVFMRIDLAGPGVSSANNSALWRWQSGSLEMIMREGDPAPTTGLTFRSHNSVYDLDDEGTAYFSAELNTAGNPSSVWRVPADRSIPLAIALPGQSLPVLPAGTTLASASLALVSTNGTLAISATLAGSGVTTANDTALLSWRDNNWTLLAREGDAPPNTQGLAWSLLVPKAISPGGRFVVAARSTGSAGTDEAFYLTTPNGLKTIVRTWTPAMGTFPPSFFDYPISGGYTVAVNDVGDVLLDWGSRVYGWRENYGVFYVASEGGSAIIDGKQQPIVAANLPSREGSEGQSRNLANDGSFLIQALYPVTPVHFSAFIRGELPPLADINGDAGVNVTDLLRVIADWGPCTTTPCASDCTHDGEVNVSDLLLVISQWGG